jgi:very-short-patch-repair endonuclease
MGSGCPICKSSKGERKINNALISYGIKYIKEYNINISNINYRFDFYLPKENTFIEFDGIQHFKPIDYFGGKEAFLKIKESDEIKNLYCEENNINIIRVDYKDTNEDIKTKLKHILSNYKKLKNIKFDKELDIEEPTKVIPKKEDKVIISLGDIISVPGRLNEKYIKKHRPDIHQEVLDYNDYDIPFKEKLWYYYNKIEQRFLCNCGNKTTFNKKFSDGYKKACSAKCVQNLPETKAKRVRTVLEKYGTTNVAKDKGIRKKIDDTNIERYGHKSSFQNKDVRDKWVKNIKEKYGVEHIFQLDSVKDQINKTMIEKYGKHYTKTEEYKEKTIITNLERYGKEWHTQTDEHKEN